MKEHASCSGRTKSMEPQREEESNNNKTLLHSQGLLLFSKEGNSVGFHMGWFGAAPPVGLADGNVKALVISDKHHIVRRIPAEAHLPQMLLPRPWQTSLINYHAISRGAQTASQPPTTEFQLAMTNKGLCWLAQPCHGFVQQRL